MVRFRPYLGLGALAAGTIFSFFSLFAGSKWIVPVLVAALGGIAVTAALERLRVPEVVRALASAVAGIWFLAIFIVPNSLKFGFPNVGRLMKVAGAAWTSATESATLLKPGPGVLLLVCAGVWLAVIISAPVAIGGRPIFAAIPWIGVFALTSSVGAVGNRLVAVIVFIPSLFTALYCIKDSPNSFRAGSARAQTLTLGWAIVLGSIATVAGVSLGSITPGYKSRGWLEGALAGPPSQTVVSPLVQIKPQLLNPDRTKLFEVKGSLPEGTLAYFRLMALDEFNGSAWGSSADYLNVEGKISYLPPEEFSGRDQSFRQLYTIEQLGGPWLPAVYQATKVLGVDASVDPRSSSLIARRRLNKGTRYEVSSGVPDVSIEDLRRAPPRSVRSQKGPDPTKLTGVSDAVRKIASDWASGQVTTYDKVVAISDRLRKFRYDENAPQGHSSDQLLSFLTISKAGYCEQFAASMAVLVRTLGIPARVAVGFLPGEIGPDPKSHVVTSRDAHAWPEVHFEGVGWIPFEPTPRAGLSPPFYDSAGAAATFQEEPVTGGQEEEPSPSPTPPPSPGPAETPDLSTPQPKPKTFSLFWLSVIAVVALVIALVLAVAIGKKWRIRRRYRMAATPAEKVRAAFFDFEDRVIDLSQPRGIAQTPAEFMEQARAGFQLDMGATGILLGNFEVAAFSGGESSDLEAQDAVKAAALLTGQLWAGSNLGGRLGFLVSPRSLLMRSSRSM